MLVLTLLPVIAAAIIMLHTIISNPNVDMNNYELLPTNIL